MQKLYICDQKHNYTTKPRLNPQERLFYCIFKIKKKYTSTIKSLFSCLFSFNHPQLILPSVVCCSVSRSKIWLYHQISIQAPTCSIASYWFLKLVQEAWNWSLQCISLVFLFVKKTFMHCSAMSVLPVCLIICLLLCSSFWSFWSGCVYVSVKQQFICNFI